MNNNTDDERKLTPLSGDDSAPGWLVLFGITGFLMGAVAMHALETPSERPAFEKEFFEGYVKPIADDYIAAH